MTDMPLNDERPMIMHIDLNSCYATIEQQANPLIRNKPVAVAAYDSPGGFIVAASYDAKRLGINLMRIRDAREICKDLIVLTPDPEKYFDAHRRFKEVLLRYTDEVTPKSIDEFVVDFRGSKDVRAGKSLEEIGLKIKADIKKSLGDYVTVNIGIAPNRFLAKVAAGLDKPDGMNTITATDIYNIYGQLNLEDLPGINHRYKARLYMAQIFTPIDFLESKIYKLKGEVFHSIVGYYWYLRLRGYESDSAKFKTKSFGNDYSVGNKTSDRNEIARLLMKLSEKTGRRLRKHDYQAGGVFLGIGFENKTWWGKSSKSKSIIYSTQDIYRAIMRLFGQVDIPARVIHLNISVYDLRPATPIQLGIFDGTRLDSKSLAQAVDSVNDRYGEYTVTPALMANMQNTILKRVPFGSVRDI